MITPVAGTRDVSNSALCGDQTTTHLRRRLSSENGLDGRRTRDRPRSTFHEPGDGRGEDDSSSSFDGSRLRRRRDRRLEVRDGSLELAMQKREMGAKNADPKAYVQDKGAVTQTGR